MHPHTLAHHYSDWELRVISLRNYIVRVFGGRKSHIWYQGHAVVDRRGRKAPISKVSEDATLFNGGIEVDSEVPPVFFIAPYHDRMADQLLQ